MREEAGELCQTLEQDEGRERTASEMADLLYHSMVLLKHQVMAGGWHVALHICNSMATFVCEPVRPVPVAQGKVCELPQILLEQRSVYAPHLECHAGGGL